MWGYSTALLSPILFTMQFTAALLRKSSIKKSPSGDFLFRERVKGIEPSSSGWKPDVIAIIQHPRIKFFLKPSYNIFGLLGIASQRLIRLWLKLSQSRSNNFRAAGNRTQSTCSQSTRTTGIRQPAASLSYGKKILLATIYPTIWVVG